MTDRKPEEPAPETVNFEQEDAGTQAQDVADDALDRATSVLGLSDTEKVPTGDEAVDEVPDLIDRMEQMDSSGMIDMSAYRGERNDDDEEGLLGPQGEEE